MVKLFNSVTAAALMALSFGNIAHATNLVSNGGFEDISATNVNPLASGGYCYLNEGQYDCGAVRGWGGKFPLIKANSAAWQTPNSLPRAAGLQNYVLGIQSLRHADQNLILPAGTYTLAWSDAGRSYGTGAGETYQVLYNNIVLESKTIANNTGWNLNSISFVAAGNGVLSFKGLTSSDNTAFIDNISVTAVPEPATYSILLAGIGLMGFMIRRRKTL